MGIQTELLMAEKEKLEQRLIEIKTHIEEIKNNKNKIRIECNVCDGTGEDNLHLCKADGIHFDIIPCKDCKGLGYTYMKPYHNKIIYY